MDLQRVDRQPYFKPWMGPAYQKVLRALDNRDVINGSLDRVHLMGESHYSEEPPSPDWTCEVIARHSAHEGPGLPFFTKALQIMAPNDSSPINRAEAWSTLAYSNFLQRPLTVPRQSVPDAYWEDARAAFFGQLAITRPTVLVCLGKRVFENLPDVGRRVPFNLAPNGRGKPIDDAWLYEYETERGKNATVVVWVYHPSAPQRFDLAEARRRQIGARMFYSNIMLALSEGSLSD